MMKPLKQLNNVERAKMLFQLFPAEMQGLIQFSQDRCRRIIDNEADERKQWQANGLYTFDFWLHYVKELSGHIEEYGNRLYKQCRLFTDQLFDGYTALVMCQCVLEHAAARESQNPNYTLAANLFFLHKY